MRGRRGELVEAEGWVHPQLAGAIEGAAADGADDLRVLLVLLVLFMLLMLLVRTSVRIGEPGSCRRLCGKVAWKKLAACIPWRLT